MIKRMRTDVNSRASWLLSHIVELATIAYHGHFVVEATAVIIKIKDLFEIRLFRMEYALGKC